MSRSRSLAVIIAPAVMVALILGACSSADDSTAATATDATLPPDATVEPAEPTAEPEPTPEPTEEPTTAPDPTPEPEPTEEPAATEQPSEPAGGDRDFQLVTDEVQSFVDERELNGAGLIVVHRDDGVIYHEHFGEFTEDRISLIASSSKMISAGVLLSLQEDGLIDINETVASQVPWGDPASDITPAQLLSNSSGLVGLGPNLLYGPYFCQWTPSDELENCGETVLAGPDDDADVIAPDTEFRYGGAQWQVAGAVAETVSGKSWEQLVDEIYVEPCGLESLGYISLGSVAGGLGYPTVFGGDPDSVETTDNPNIEGGAYVNTGDYATLLLMHLRGGMCGDTQVLSQDSLDIMHTDRVGPTYGSEIGYGMGWWVDSDTGRISDGGAFGTVPWLDLDDGYGAYLVIEDSSDTGQELAQLIEELVHDAVTG